MIRCGMLRRSSKDDIEKGEERRTENVDYAWNMNNEKVYSITKSSTIQDYIQMQNTKWVAHVTRGSNDTLTKRLMFVDEKFTKRGSHHRTVFENVTAAEEGKGKSVETFLRECMARSGTGVS